MFVQHSQAHKSPKKDRIGAWLRKHETLCIDSSPTASRRAIACGWNAPPWLTSKPALSLQVLFFKSSALQESDTHTAACDQRENTNPYVQTCLKVEGKSQQQKKAKRPQRVFLLPFHRRWSSKLKNAFWHWNLKKSYATRCLCFAVTDLGFPAAEIKHPTDLHTVLTLSVYISYLETCCTLHANETACAVTKIRLSTESRHKSPLLESSSKERTFPVFK